MLPSVSPFQRICAVLGASPGELRGHTRPAPSFNDSRARNQLLSRVRLLEEAQVPALLLLLPEPR
jgi:hypothetical protein